MTFHVVISNTTERCWYNSQTQSLFRLLLKTIVTP